MRLVIAILRPIAYWLSRLFFKVEFHGVANVPPEGACLITPNHISYGDPIWITIPIRRRVYYMAWDRPFEIPVLGFIMRAFGAFPVSLDAVDASAQRNALDVLRNGRALVMFPEGGRSHTGKLMPFKLGAFRFALTYGVPIVPVSINGAENIWPVGKVFPRPGKLVITYHPPIQVERVPEDISRAELKERARAYARKTHDIVAAALDPSSLPEGDDGREVSLGANP
ncbi:MAG: lysophospholipid acyltransferase family protein [Blastocatellia bacterium]